MSVNVYDTYQDADSFDVLLAGARAIAADLVAKNPTLP
jgi:hypothetical protein